MYISDPPVPFWSCLYQKNTTWYKFFGCTRLFVLNMKTHVKSTRRKRLRTPSRTNLRSYIAHHPRLPTLPSRKTNLTMATSTTGMHLSRRTYVPVFLQTVKYIYQSHQSPSGPAYNRKTLQVFPIYKSVWFGHENTFQNYQAKKATHIIQNKS